MNTEIHFSNNSDEWSTPQDLFDSLNEEFNFTIDVASSPSNTKLANRYTIEDDGLSKNWDGEIVWCNPPYSQLKKWVEKCATSKCTSVMLIPARTDTIAFHTYIYNKPNVEIRFLKGRLKFSNSKNSAPFPSMLIIFKNNNI